MSIIKGGKASPWAIMPAVMPSPATTVSYTPRIASWQRALPVFFADSLRACLISTPELKRMLSDRHTRARESNAIRRLNNEKLCTIESVVGFWKCAIRENPRLTLLEN